MTGTRDQFIWNGGRLWAPASPPVFPAQRTKTTRQRNMKRQRYFPALASARPGWFANYTTQLDAKVTVLGLDPAEAAASMADARFLEHVTGEWLTAVRE